MKYKKEHTLIVQLSMTLCYNVCYSALKLLQYEIYLISDQ